ncbi:MAG: sensor histidine kinase [Anaerolineae bacterium]
MTESRWPDRWEARHEAQKTLLDIFTSAHRIPIGLFERREGRVIRIASEASLDALEEPYCRALQSLPGGREACMDDQCLRAQKALDTGKPELTLCHAGLYSQAMPIVVDGTPRAVLLYGEMRIADPTLQDASWKKHREAMARLGLEDAETQRLEDLFHQVKQFSPDDLETLKTTLSRVGVWLYRLLDQEDRLERQVERVMHEVQTRVQAVLANAELLFLELPTIPGLKPSIRNRTSEVLNTALALSTVVHNLGDFLEDYRFTKQPIEKLLLEAKRIYAAEATRREVKVFIDVEPVGGRPPELTVSEDHLQYALNNLMHNAIKYSFRGGPGRERYVRVEGKPAGPFYSITFESYGVGILPEEIEQGLIFLDGYQGRLTRGEYRTGSGKGLYFTKRVIDRHGGRIEVTSTLVGDTDKGPEGQPHLNRFTIYLPYDMKRKEE